jgi:hypothetical protein
MQRRATGKLSLEDTPDGYPCALEDRRKVGHDLSSSLLPRARGPACEIEAGDRHNPVRHGAHDPTRSK